MTTRKAALSERIDVRLSLTDWMLLLGWCSAHVNDATQEIISASISEISRQVVS